MSPLICLLMLPQCNIKWVHVFKHTIKKAFIAQHGQDGCLLVLSLLSLDQIILFQVLMLQIGLIIQLMPTLLESKVKTKVHLFWFMRNLDLKILLGSPRLTESLLINMCGSWKNKLDQEAQTLHPQLLESQKKKNARSKSA